ALSENEIHAGDFDRLGADAEGNGEAAGTQALEGRGERLATRSPYQKDPGTAKRLEGPRGIPSAPAAAVVSPERPSQPRRFSAAPNRRDLETHVGGVLDPEMTEPPDSKYGDKFAGLCRRIAQSVEGRESSAQERRSTCRRQVVRDAHEPSGL